MKISLYRYSMLIAAFALLALSIFYFIGYAGVAVAVTKSVLTPFYQMSVRALWLTFASQSLLFALLYFLVAARPRSVSREVIVICGLLQLVAAILMFSYAGNSIVMYLLAVAALSVLVGSVLWPSEEALAAAKLQAAAYLSGAKAATAAAANPASAMPTSTSTPARAVPTPAPTSAPPAPLD